MKKYAETITTENEVAKLQLLALLPEKADMKPVRKILSDEQAMALVSMAIKQGLPLHSTCETP